MNTLNSGLVACKRKVVSKDHLEALCLLCCIIFICIHVDKHNLFGKDVAFDFFFCLLNILSEGDFSGNSQFENTL